MNINPTIVDAKAVTKNIKTIALNGAKLDTLIHTTAVDCILLSMPHAEGGHLDAGSAARLLNAMPKGSRAKALVAWFAAYSNVVLKLDDNKQWTARLHRPESKLYKPADVAAAKAKPFWTPEETATDPKVFTLGKALASMLAKAARAETAGELSAEDRRVLAAIRSAAKPVLPQQAPA